MTSNKVHELQDQSTTRLYGKFKAKFKSSLVNINVNVNVNSNSNFNFHFNFHFNFNTHVILFFILLLTNNPTRELFGNAIYTRFVNIQSRSRTSYRDSGLAPAAIDLDYYLSSPLFSPSNQGTGLCLANGFEFIYALADRWVLGPVKPNTRDRD
ncbi:hypothetical protein BOTNAR_0136g00030 [Botryotinia narcissicola]|uniref:Uncharacterized protein n=1 Tax=Botryotinia narcissicola TaxID=278944 RepID=A0A4Z1IP12_9HELO|nr:hypothetical protein BOTNAR_0136g00030 [Botryotinia narcissicola]